MKVLVTGGSGFIGSALVKQWLVDGCQVRVLDNNSRGSFRRIEDIIEDIEFIEGDVRNKETVADACKGVDCVCHLAYINGTELFYKMPELVLEVGVKGMMNVIDGCIKHNVPEMILASSSEVYQTPAFVPTDEDTPLMVPDVQNPRYSYGGGKIISELMAINYGRKHFERVVIFRPHNVYGPDMGWEHVIPQFVLRMQALSNDTAGAIKFPIQGSGKETRAFIYIEDFMSGLMKVIEHGEHLGVYHIGTSDEILIEYLAREVGRCFDRDIMVIHSKIMEGSTERRCPDISRLAKLGFRPTITIQEGLRKTVDWYVQNVGLRPENIPVP